MSRLVPRYILLAVIVGSACWARGSCAWTLFRVLSNPDAAPEAPFEMMTATRTIGTSDLWRDQLLAINGRPFNSYLQYNDAVFGGKPGDRITLTLSKPNGEAVEKAIAIPSQRRNFKSWEQVPLALVVEVLVPLVCIFLGTFAVAVRPLDRNAWLLLLVMVSFTEMASRDVGSLQVFSQTWSLAMSGLLPAFMMLFGIYFPEPPGWETRRPWLKYLLIVLCATVPLFGDSIFVLWLYDVNASMAYRPILVGLVTVQTLVGMVAVTTYFINIGIKSRLAASADSRRRLRILLWGSSVSLTPTLLLAVNALIGRHDLFRGPWPVVATAFAFLAIFPLTLAYVIIVERAMDLRFVLRKSLQYGIVQGGLWTLRATVIGFAVVYIRGTMKTGHQWTPVESLLLVAGVLVARRNVVTKFSQRLDKQFFRESYDAEHVLAGLAKEAGSFMEIEPLLRDVASRISGTLHVPDIAILLREEDWFVPRYSTRPGEPMKVAAEGYLAKALLVKDVALVVDFEKPAPWLRSLAAEELQALNFMRTQLLLPLTGRGQLTGMMSLGPKLSEAPYSAVDIRLLQAIASQMSLALENSRLVASLAAEAADKERANRELEIAREVQERLFPQNFPTMAGLDCWGYCRPARGVGGDYYDFLKLEDGRLGIAIGDVSGKGIAAALLMASLQASLRGQAMAGVHDLASLMKNVNTLVYEASTSNRYATFFYGEYDTVTRRFSFVNAGHNAPLVLRGDDVLRLEACGPVVGLLPGARYGQDEFCLQAGDVFVAYTDGISEALNEAEEEWEEERFVAAAQAAKGLSAKGMIEAIFRAADAFTGAAKQYDDMTLLVVKVA